MVAPIYSFSFSKLVWGAAIEDDGGKDDKLLYSRWPSYFVMGTPTLNLGFILTANFLIIFASRSLWKKVWDFRQCSKAPSFASRYVSKPARTPTWTVKYTTMIWHKWIIYVNRITWLWLWDWKLSQVTHGYKKQVVLISHTLYVSDTC